MWPGGLQRPQLELDVSLRLGRGGQGPISLSVASTLNNEVQSGLGSWCHPPHHRDKSTHSVRHAAAWDSHSGRSRRATLCPVFRGSESAEVRPGQGHEPASHLGEPSSTAGRHPLRLLPPSRIQGDTIRLKLDGDSDRCYNADAPCGPCRAEQAGHERADTTSSPGTRSPEKPEAAGWLPGAGDGVGSEHLTRQCHLGKMKFWRWMAVTFAQLCECV